MTAVVTLGMPGMAPARSTGERPGAAQNSNLFEDALGRKPAAEKMPTTRDGDDGEPKARWRIVLFDPTRPESLAGNTEPDALDKDAELRAQDTDEETADESSLFSILMGRDQPRERVASAVEQKKVSSPANDAGVDTAAVITEAGESLSAADTMSDDAQQLASAAETAEAASADDVVDPAEPKVAREPLATATDRPGPRDVASQSAAVQGPPQATRGPTPVPAPQTTAEAPPETRAASSRPAAPEVATATAVEGPDEPQPRPAARQDQPAARATLLEAAARRLEQASAAKDGPRGQDLPGVAKASVSVTPPAPAAVQALPTTAASLVGPIVADPAAQAVARETQQPAHRSAASAATPGTSLRIQLHPAELGMVTARLTASGDQLQIEIQVESNDARQRLTSETDAILKALRSTGFEVDRLTIVQSTPQAATTAGGQNSSAMREGMAQQNQGGTGDERQGRARGGEEGARQGATSGNAQNTGSDLYI